MDRTPHPHFYGSRGSFPRYLRVHLSIEILSNYPFYHYRILTYTGSISPIRLSPSTGAPKTIRGYVAGERFGLDSLLDAEEALRWGRNLGSPLCMLPANYEKLYFKQV